MPALLINAVKASNIPLIKKLLASGVNVDERDEEGMTPLMHAPTHQIAALLIRHGANVNAKDNEGWTPLMHTEDVKVANLLTIRGADVNAADISGRSALSHACNAEIARRLIRKGANLNYKDGNGNTNLMHVLYPETALVLIEHGADVNARNKTGMTPLMMTEFADVAEALIERGAEVEAKKNDGCTALMLAAFHGHADAVEALLERGAEVEAKSKNGWTALMLAAERGRSDIIKLLLKNGANIHTKDKNGRKAIEHAHYYSESYELLKSYSLSIPDTHSEKYAIKVDETIKVSNLIGEIMEDSSQDIEGNRNDIYSKNIFLKPDDSYYLFISSCLNIPSDKIDSLDGIYLSVLNQFLKSKKMDKKDFKSLCAKYNCMEHAAIDNINSWSDEIFEDDLISSEDNYYILNDELMEKINDSIAFKH